LQWNPWVQKDDKKHTLRMRQWYWCTQQTDEYCDSPHYE